VKRKVERLGIITVKPAEKVINKRGWLGRMLDHLPIGKRLRQVKT
jgi:hypothetical protein